MNASLNKRVFSLALNVCLRAAGTFAQPNVRQSWTLQGCWN